MKKYTGVPAYTRLIAHLTIVAFALLVAVQLSAQTPQTSSPIDDINSLVTIAEPSFDSEVDLLDQAVAADMLPAHPSFGEVTISDVGVVAKRNLVYMTLEASDDLTATVDVYAMDGSLIARPIEKMLFSRGKQRFGIDLPSRMRAGTYLLKVATPRGVISRSFVLSR